MASEASRDRGPARSRGGPSETPVCPPRSPNAAQWPRAAAKIIREFDPFGANGAAFRASVATDEVWWDASQKGHHPMRLDATLLPAFFASVFASAREPVWVVEDTGRCIYANESAGRFEAGTPIGLLGAPWLAGHHGPAVDALRDALARAHRERSPQRVEHGPLNREPGAWFDTRVTPFPGGVLVIANACTARSHERELPVLAATFNSVQDAVIATDLSGAVSLINPAAARLSGWSRDEAVGRPLVDVLWLVDAPSTATAREVIDTILRRTARDGFTHHTVLVSRSGARLSVAASGATVHDAQGAPLGYVFFAKDVTAELPLNTRAQSLARLEAVGRLAGGIAHDFNNLLSVISGYAQMVLDELPSASPLRDDLQEMLSASDRAAGLTRQLLAFSRQQHLKPKLIDPSEIVRSVGRMLMRVLGEDIQLTVHAPAGLGHVRVDPTQLEQLVMNLAINARDAMPKGGRLSLELSYVELDEAHLELHPQSRLGPHLMLAVTDSGIGMDAETRQRIFEPFFTTKERGKGTGLGLATVYGIVKQSGGNIWVYSEPGLGTTFKVYLPVCRDAPEDDSAPSITLPPQSTGVILVVEDEAPLRALIGRILQRDGLTALIAANGHEALEILKRSHEVDLLLTDVVMPGMSGPELAAQATSLRPGLRVLFMSGYTDHAATQQGLVDVGAALIEKPLSAKVLLRRLHELLGDA
ncbi:MAG: ATP-binding protein [Polyangiales bacterium]